MVWSIEHCTLNMLLQSAIAPRTTLLSAAEPGRELRALTLTARRINPYHDLIPFLYALCRDFHIRPIGDAHHHRYSLQVIFRSQLPHAPSA